MFIAMMSCYVPLYVLLFKSKEESINVETILINKIHELQIENVELRAKLASFDKETDDEKLSIKKPLGDDEGDDEGDEKKTNNLTESFSEDLNFGRI
jgi:hypothetical protein